VAQSPVPCYPVPSPTPPPPLPPVSLPSWLLSSPFANSRRPPYARGRRLLGSTSKGLVEAELAATWVALPARHTGRQVDARGRRLPGSTRFAVPSHEPRSELQEAGGCETVRRTAPDRRLESGASGWAEPSRLGAAVQSLRECQGLYVGNECPSVFDAIMV
jgi:hypothetical protein